MSGVELFTIGTMVVTAADAVAVAAGVSAAVGSVVTASATASAAEFNAKRARQNADIARNNAVARADLYRIKGARAIGQLKAAMGASGVSMEGSPLEVLGMTAALNELDIQTELYKGDLEATGFENTARLETAKAKGARIAGTIGAVSSLLGAGAQVALLGSGSAAAAGTAVTSTGGGGGGASIPMLMH